MTRLENVRPRAIWRFIRRLLLALLAFALLFPPLYSLLVPEQRGPPVAMPAAAPGTYQLFVADWGYHTSIIVPQPRGWSLGPPGKERAPFLEFAWGDRRFYMSSDYRPQALFATVVLPTAAVTYLDGWPDSSPLAGARTVYARTVDAVTLRTLLIELERTLRHAGGGVRLAPYGTVSGYDGRFYPAYGRYFWVRNCNWWTVARLRDAQLAESGTGVLFSGQVANRLRGFHRVPAR